MLASVTLDSRIEAQIDLFATHLSYHFYFSLYHYVRAMTATAERTKEAVCEGPCN